MAYLLDVNVLVALFDEAHIHHLAAHAWFEHSHDKGWITCPITENGFLRILSHPSYPNAPLPMRELSERLEEFKAASTNYQFWSDDYSLSAWLVGSQLALHSAHAADAYLLNLCQRKEGVLATFDRRIQSSLIGEARSGMLEILPV
jgi:hypothetical protein